MRNHSTSNGIDLLVIQNYATISFYPSWMAQITHVHHVENRIFPKKTG